MIDNRSYRYDPHSYGSDGTRWAEEEEIKNALTEIDLDKPHPGICGLPMISDGHIAYVDNTDSHSLIMGSTGSKKSRLLVMPMMQMIAQAGESVVCTDPKGELYRLTSGYFAQEDYDIRVINLRDPRRSHGWSPLESAIKYSREGKLDRAHAVLNDLAVSLFPMTKDPFWAETSRALFTGLAGLIVEKPELFRDHSLRVIEQLFNKLDPDDSPSRTGTLKLANEYPADSIARTSLTTAVLGSETTWRNVSISYRSAIQKLFVMNSLIDMLSTPDMDFRQIGMKKTAVYIIMPDEKTTLHSIVSMLIKQCYEDLIDQAQLCDGLSLPIRVNFLLDEFSNLPTIPDMSSMISAARSRNIRFYLVIQSLHQLVSKYQDDAYTIRGNCTNWVFLTSRELSLLNEISELCGINSRTNQPLISVSQLQRLNKESGEALVLCGRLYPHISYLADIEEYPFQNLPPVPLPELPELRVKLPDIDALCETLNRLHALSAREQTRANLRQEAAAAEIVSFGRWLGQSMAWYRVWSSEEAGVELLVAKTACAAMPFDAEHDEHVLFRSSTLGRWLNDSFFTSCFSKEEAAQIVERPREHLRSTFPLPMAMPRVFLPTWEMVGRLLEPDASQAPWADGTYWLLSRKLPDSDNMINTFTIPYCAQVSADNPDLLCTQVNVPCRVLPAILRHIQSEPQIKIKHDNFDLIDEVNSRYEQLFGKSSKNTEGE